MELQVHAVLNLGSHPSRAGLISVLLSCGARTHTVSEVSNNQHLETIEILKSGTRLSPGFEGFVTGFVDRGGVCLCLTLQTRRCFSRPLFPEA
jgi:hypothetical protein